MMKLLCAIALALTFAHAPLARAASGVDDNRDPLEPLNRRVFWLNERLDDWILEPVARGWDWVVPDPAQTALTRFFQNLRFPIVFTNDLLQAKPSSAATDVGRFVINSTVGLAGFLDLATDVGLARNEEDTGQTLGRYGLPGGAYLVLPLFGPSNPRDLVGTLADSMLMVYPWFAPALVTLPLNTVNLVNARAGSLQTVDNARDATLDLYVAARNGYKQRRDSLIADGESTMTRQQELDLYFPEDDRKE